MDELIERLRDESSSRDGWPDTLLDEAADALTTMQAREATLIRALEKIASWTASDDAKGSVAYMLYEQLTGIAREALATSELVER